MKDNARALQRYERVAQRFPDHALGSRSARARRTPTCYLERWPRAGELADLFLERESAPKPFDAVVAFSARRFRWWLAATTPERCASWKRGAT
jgi:hypothetical protein